MELAYPYVLFDLGNTLIYFDGTWKQVIDEMNQAVTDALCEMGYRLDRQSFPSEFGTLADQYYQRRDEDYVETTTLEVLRQALAANHIHNVETHELRKAVQKMFAVSQAHWHVEPDTASTLEALRASGRRLGIISNASDDQDVQTLIDKAGIRSFFDVVVVSAAYGWRKPGKKIFDRALDHWKAGPDQAVMIGDTLPADILGANQAGIASIWIRRRVDTPENHALAESIRPRATVDSLAEIPALLDRRGW